MLSLPIGRTGRDARQQSWKKFRLTEEFSFIVIVGCYFYHCTSIPAAAGSFLGAAMDRCSSIRGRHMNKMTFPNACQVMRWHFHPLGFEASMDAPSSMIARLFDRASGQTLLAIAGIPCATVMNAADVELIIEAVEAELDAFVPPQSLCAVS
jgi:hypothetical protein